jgi:integrase
MLDGAISINPSQQTARNRRPIYRSILTQIMSTSITLSIKEINIDAAFCLAYAGCLRMGEITYTKKEAGISSFGLTHATRSDVSFALDHLTLRLKRSKTDKAKQGVTITIASTSDTLCPVQALRRLFELDPQPPGAPLFNAGIDAHGTTTPFTASLARKNLSLRLVKAGIPPAQYTGHSFRRGAAQDAMDKGFSDEEIQRLGRWTSEAFRLYCTTSQEDLFRLSVRFQRTNPPFTQTAI